MKRLIILFFLLLPTPVLAIDSEEEIGCLVEAVYFEARGESLAGKVAVINVILERVDSRYFPNSICGVVHDGVYREGMPVRHRCAFSYWCDGKPERYGNLRDLGEVKKAVEFFIASGATIASVQGATHYHTPFVTPYWIFAECMVYLGQVDNHLFYICDK